MNRTFWKGMFVACVVMLVVLILSVSFNDRGSATFIVTQLAAIHVVAAMVIIGTMLYFDWDPFSAFR